MTESGLTKDYSTVLYLWNKSCFLDVCQAFAKLPNPQTLSPSYFLSITKLNFNKKRKQKLVANFLPHFSGSWWFGVLVVGQSLQFWEISRGLVTLDKRGFFTQRCFGQRWLLTKKDTAHTKDGTNRHHHVQTPPEKSLKTCIHQVSFIFLASTLFFRVLGFFVGST